MRSLKTLSAESNPRTLSVQKPFLSSFQNSLAMLTKLRFPVLAALSLLLVSACTDVELPIGTSDTRTTVETLSGNFNRFAIVGDYLYGVDQSTIATYDISNRENPVEINRQEIGLAIETIYPFENTLFIGSRRGMFMYLIQSNGIPRRQGSFDYGQLTGGVTPCDPVVGNRTTAFASLFTNERDERCGRPRIPVQSIVVLDVTNPSNITHVHSEPVSTPRGISLDGNLLFVARADNGLDVYDVSNRSQFVLLSEVKDIFAYDVRAINNKLVVAGATEVIQYDYSNPSQLVELSRLPYPQS